MTDRPCKYIGDTEGSLKNPKIVKQDLLEQLTPVELIRIDTVKKISAYDSSKKYDAQEFTFYSTVAHGYYRVALKSEVKNTILASMEIDDSNKMFTTERQPDGKRLWCRAFTE